MLKKRIERGRVQVLQAITIEVANSASGGEWPVSDKAYNTFIELCVDICKRNHIPELVFTGNPDGSLTHHRMFQATSCPVDYLLKKFPEICRLVNVRLKDVEQPTTSTPTYPISNKNLQTMVVAGVVNSPDYWIKKNVQWLNELFEKATPMVSKQVNNGVNDFYFAINLLVEAKIIDSPEYWINKAKEIEYLDQFLINMSNKCKIILQKIIWAEARGEDEKGQMLVVNVIFNRMKDKRFPNTIYDIVFAPNQFEPTRNGAYDKATPSNKEKQSVDKALCVDYSQGALYFRTIKGAVDSCWHERALSRLFDHGAHRFYK